MSTLQPTRGPPRVGDSSKILELNQGENIMVFQYNSEDTYREELAPSMKELSEKARRHLRELELLRDTLALILLDTEERNSREAIRDLEDEQR